VSRVEQELFTLSEHMNSVHPSVFSVLDHMVHDQCGVNHLIVFLY
jgi:hypothetical protein